MLVPNIFRLLCAMVHYHRKSETPVSCHLGTKEASKSKSSSSARGGRSASSSADVLLAQLDDVPRSRYPPAIIDDDHDEPDELEADWNDAINARYGFDEGPEASSSSSSNQGTKRKRASSKPKGSQTVESSGGDMPPVDPNVPQRCFVDPSNQRVIAEFADGTKKALGNSFATRNKFYYVKILNPRFPYIRNQTIT